MMGSPIKSDIAIFQTSKWLRELIILKQEVEKGKSICQD